MRAWLEALEDKSLPSLEIADPEGEVASAFKVSPNFNGERENGGKRRRGWHYQSTCGKGSGVWHNSAGILTVLRGRDAATAAGGGGHYVNSRASLSLSI